MRKYFTVTKLVACKTRARTIAFACVLSTTSTWVSADTPLDQFKTYLESPPIIEHIVFERKVLSHVSGINDENPVVYSAVWQPDSFLIRDIHDIADHTNDYMQSGLIVCEHKEKGWCVQNGWLKTTTDLTARNDVTVTIDVFRRILTQAVLLGSPNIVIGSLKWTGNRTFQATNFGGNHVEGEIVGITNGLPSSITYHFQNTSGQLKFLLTFNYDKTVHSYLPATVGTYFVGSQGEKRPLSEIKILQIEFTNSPMGDSYFESSRFYDVRKKSPLIFSTNNLLSLKEGQRITKVQNVAPIEAQVSPNKSVRWIVLSFLLLTTVVSVWLGLRTAQRKQ